MKQCIHCLEYKNENDFSIARNTILNSCKACGSLRTQKYYRENKEYRDKKKELGKLYYKNNKKDVKIRRLLWYKKNKEKVLEDNRIWYLNNKKKAHISASNYIKRKRLIDSNYKIQNNIGNRLRSVLKNNNVRKNNRTLEYVGCSIEELRQYIERQFVKGMSWDNYGEWEIDHIYPISRFDFTIEENIYKAMNYKNLQPLWKIDNIRKGNKIVIHSFT